MSLTSHTYNPGIRGETGSATARVYRYAVEYKDDLISVTPTPEEGDIARVYRPTKILGITVPSKKEGAYTFTNGVWEYGSRSLQEEILSNDADIAALQSEQLTQNNRLTQIENDLTTIEDESFETTSKNLKSWGYTLNYTGSQLTSIVYSDGSNTITKTLNYTGSQLTSIVLSGDTPLGIDLTKTLSYTGNSLTSITYS